MLIHQGKNYYNQISGEDGDHTKKEDIGEADDTLSHGRPLVEVLAVRAHLSVIGMRIIAFDCRRGQIIYSHDKQGEHAATEDLVLTGPYRGISADGRFTIRVDIPNTEPARFKWDYYDPCIYDEVDAVEPSYVDIKARDGSKVAGVTYAVMSNALEATVQVMLRLKNGHILTGVHGETKARIDGMEVGSILFNPTQQGAGQCFSRVDDSWFVLDLARNVVAVPCGKLLHIEVDLEGNLFQWPGAQAFESCSQI